MAQVASARAAPPMGDGDITRMSQDDFKQYVLYVFPGDANCDRAMGMLTPDVSVQDVTKLDALPAFIDGVPILADKKSESLVRGTACLRALQELKKSELIPAPTASGFSANTGALRGRSFESAEMLTTPYAAVQDQGGYEVAIGDDKVSEGTVTDYMQLRDRVTNAVVKEKQEQQGGAQGRAPPQDDP